MKYQQPLRMYCAQFQKKNLMHHESRDQHYRTSSKGHGIQVSTGGGAAHTLRGHQHLGNLQTRNRLLIHNAHGPQGVKHGLMHMVPSNVTYHMHPVDGDIMKHMNVVRPRLLFGLHTVVTVCSVGV